MIYIFYFNAKWEYLIDKAVVFFQKDLSKGGASSLNRYHISFTYLSFFEELSKRLSDNLHTLLA